MERLTDRQCEVLRFIQDFKARHQRPPTYRDIATRFQIRVFAAQNHVAALAAKGWIRRERGRHRAMAC
jgi:SOS-response transcriptional repressor LexA